MATATPIIVATVDLSLTAEEARWLVGFLQNSHGDPHDEPVADERMRGDIFDALKAALKSFPKPPPS